MANAAVWIFAQTEKSHDLPSRKIQGGHGSCTRPLRAFDDLAFLVHLRAILPDAGSLICENGRSRVKAVFSAGLVSLITRYRGIWLCQPRGAVIRNRLAVGRDGVHNRGRHSGDPWLGVPGTPTQLAAADHDRIGRQRPGSPSHRICAVEQMHAGHRPAPPDEHAIGAGAMGLAVEDDFEQNFAIGQ